TEPVNFITQRFVLMAAFFYLLTLLLYVQYRRSLKKTYLFTALGSGLAAMLCKEFTVTLPVMLVLYEFYFLGNEKAAVRFKRLAPFFAIALVVPFLLLRPSSHMLDVAFIADSKV